jgi:hypothetical protein
VRRKKMTRCEIRKCPDFKNKLCMNELDFVNRYTGEKMCPYDSNAIHIDEYENNMEEEDD